MAVVRTQSMGRVDMTEIAFRWLDFAGLVFKRLEWLSKIVLFGSAVMFVAMLFANRAPPLVGLPHDPITVTAGQWAEISVPVMRDLSRRCSVTYTRRVVDSDGSKFDLPSGGESPDSIRHNETQSPGRMRVMVLIPPARTVGSLGIDAGPGKIITTRHWVCNPAQAIWPIEQTAQTPIYVLAP